MIAFKLVLKTQILVEKGIFHYNIRLTLLSGYNASDYGVCFLFFFFGYYACMWISLLFALYEFLGRGYNACPLLVIMYFETSISIIYEFFWDVVTMPAPYDLSCVLILLNELNNASVTMWHVLWPITLAPGAGDMSWVIIYLE